MTEQVVSVHQAQSELLERLYVPQPVVIAAEGGPCGGKTTLVKAIAGAAITADRPVVVLPEAATEHITDLQAAGIDPLDLLTNDRPGWMAFEQRVLTSIVRNIEQARQDYAGTDAVIIADRADIGAYVTQPEYREILGRMGRSHPPLHDMVSSVIYLPSVASVNPSLYTQLQATNGARYETSIEHAAATCTANLAVVQSHPELRVLWGGDFDRTIQRLTQFALYPELAATLSYAVPAELAVARLRRMELGGMVLNSMTIGDTAHMLDGQVFRLRKSSGDDNVVHYRLDFMGRDGRKRYRQLTEEQYELLRATPQIGDTVLRMRYVVLGEPSQDGVRRLWHYDHDLDPGVDEWQLSTHVYDAEHAAEVAAELDLAVYRRVDEAQLITRVLPRQGTL